MKPGILLFLFTVTVASGCAKTDFEMLPAKKCTANNDVIPINEAMASLDELMSGLDLTMKSGVVRTYSNKSVVAIGKNDFSSLTKSSGAKIDIPDTLIYLVNFDNDLGFAVISGNRKVGEHVYCVTEQGGITSEDFKEAYSYLSTVVNTKLPEDYDDSNERYVSLGPIFVPTLILSSALNTLLIGSPIESETDTKGAGTPVTGSGPRLWTKWTQTGPFDDLTPNNCPAGCVVIAVGQIMVYNQYSIDMSYNNHDCDWYTMRKVYPYYKQYEIDLPVPMQEEAKLQVASFAVELGRSYHCNVDYDMNGSSATDAAAQRTLKNYGYQNVYMYSGFGSSNQGKVKRALERNTPVYLGAMQKGSINKGHAWVVDGYYGDYFHCNFGWQGTSDGYYSGKTFDTTQKPDYIDDWYDKFISSKQSDYIYSWGFRIITAMKP